jgi:mannose/fructose/N-acetylgalactosamine-specific phosphotransferase system component IIC
VGRYPDVQESGPAPCRCGQHTRRELEAARAAGETLQINVLGLASIAEDVSPDLARATIASVVVLGAFRASPAVKAALAGRIS